MDKFKIGLTICPIKYWLEFSGNKPEQAWVVYGGEEQQKRTSGNVIGWKHIEEIVA